MPDFSITGIDELANEVIRMGEATGDMARKMLEAGAKELEESWKIAIRKHRHIQSGDMIKSVKATEIKENDGALSVEVFPQGKSREKGRKNQVPNAEKAFHLHYGWKGKDGTHFVDEVEEGGGTLAEDAMTKVFEEYMKGGK